MTGAEILALPMPGNDAGAPTVHHYLVALLRQLWRDGEGFSGKRPFGNSGWEYDLQLGVSGVTEFDEETGDYVGDIVPDANQRVRLAIDALLA